MQVCWRWWKKPLNLKVWNSSSVMVFQGPNVPSFLLQVIFLVLQQFSEIAELFNPSLNPVQLCRSCLTQSQFYWNLLVPSNVSSSYISALVRYMVELFFTEPACSSICAFCPSLLFLNHKSYFGLNLVWGSASRLLLLSLMFLRVCEMVPWWNPDLFYLVIYFSEGQLSFSCF